MQFKDFFQLIKKSVVAWVDDYAPSMGAAISYYTVFSIAPLMIIVIAVAGFVWGREAVQGQLVGQLSGMLGEEGAKGVQSLVESASQPAQGIVATAISIVVLVVGATTVFAELQSALDRIWQVPQAPKAGGIWGMVRSRLLSLGFILGLGFLLLVSLITSAGIAAIGTWADGLLPGWEALLYIVNIALSVGIATVLFAMIYKFMPQADVGWRDVWVGAGVTAVLFEVGKWLISLYIGKSSVTSSFAAAGSLVVLLVWVYYSAQIFLLGAEFTWAYANDHGSRANAGQTGLSATDAGSNARSGRSPAVMAVRSGQTAGTASPVEISDASPAAVVALQHQYPAVVPAKSLVASQVRPASFKQKAIVYAGSAAALLALRLLLKHPTRSRRGFGRR